MAMVLCQGIRLWHRGITEEKEGVWNSTKLCYVICEWSLIKNLTRDCSKFGLHRVSKLFRVLNKNDVWGNF